MMDEHRLDSSTATVQPPLPYSIDPAADTPMNRGPAGSNDGRWAVLAGRRIVLDCRWLGLGGAGRATEHLLRGLMELRPPGEWFLWGALGRDFAWEGCNVVAGRRHPLRLMGQGDFFSIPKHDLIVYMHQVRPLRPGPAVTLMHDTIPLRHGGWTGKRLLKRAFYLLVARLSLGIITVSQHSATTIASDTGIPRGQIRVVHYPVDTRLAEHVKTRREELHGRVPRALYVGRFDRHKNLERLVRAFQRTRLCAGGGELRLVGGGHAECERLRAFAAQIDARGVSVQPGCSDEELVQLYAESSVLVMPSLEEGFGLPAWEALACELPVAVSRAGSLPEVVGDAGILFDPLSLDEIAAAIDAACGSLTPQLPVSAAQSCAGFAAEFLDSIVELAAAGRTVRSRAVSR